MRGLVIAGLVAIAAPCLAAQPPAPPKACVNLAARYGQAVPAQITPAEARLVLRLLALADQADRDVKTCRAFLEKEANR